MTGLMVTGVQRALLEGNDQPLFGQLEAHVSCREFSFFFFLFLF